MSQIKVSDLAYCRLQVPDLDLAEQFLTDFGLVPVVRETGRRFFRATDASAYCYEVKEGPKRFLGFAFNAKSHSDLEAVAKSSGAPIERIDAPGGGWRVRQQEPNGYDVDIVHGIEAAEAIPVARQHMNTGAEPLRRAGDLMRLPRRKATPVKRLAHVVIGTPKVQETVDWFCTNFGMIPSDQIVKGPEKAPFGAFIRVDDGDIFVDHHSLFVIGTADVGLHHLSFEAQDVDAVFGDHHYLRGLEKYEHLWGIGRHLLGSQIFDYWIDPFGYPHEHWTDSDRLNSSSGTNTWDIREGMVTQWGEEPPARFRKPQR